MERRMVEKLVVMVVMVAGQGGGQGYFWAVAIFVGCWLEREGKENEREEKIGVYI